MYKDTDALVHITNQIQTHLETLITEHIQPSKTVVLVDENTKKYCLPLVHESLGAYHLIEIKSGELHKHLETCQFIWTKMTEWRLDRKALFVNLGGGVIGDMGGFAASCYKRGIRFLTIPTTLLAQVDASVGGKLGVDFMGFKNHIGLFRNPLQTIIFTEFLKTLPEEEWYSGFAEIIKHAIIRDESKLNSYMKADRLQDLDIDQILPASIAIKDAVVSEDMTEQGLRKILNFGHTLGHGIETWALQGGSASPIPHGYGVVMGMIAELFLSCKKHQFSEEKMHKIVDWLLLNYEIIAIPESAFAEIVGHVSQDKKNVGAVVQAVLLEDIETCVIDAPISEDDIVASLLFLEKKRAEKRRVEKKDK